MAQPDIHDLINLWVETHGWPVHEGITIGPAKCGIGRCRKKHAYARSRLEGNRGGPMANWVYERPCDINAPMGADRARP